MHAGEKSCKETRLLLQILQMAFPCTWCTEQYYYRHMTFSLWFSSATLLSPQTMSIAMNQKVESIKQGSLSRRSGNSLVRVRSSPNAARQTPYFSPKHGIHACAQCLCNDQCIGQPRPLLCTIPLKDPPSLLKLELLESALLCTAGHT